MSFLDQISDCSLDEAAGLVAAGKPKWARVRILGALGLAWADGLLTTDALRGAGGHKEIADGVVAIGAEAAASALPYLLAAL